MSSYIGYVQEFDATHETKDVYTYRIGVCVDVDDDHPDCAVVQYETDENRKARCAGKVNTAQIARSGDGVWIELTYTGGDNYTSHCDKRARMTRLAFLCDPNINGKGKVEFLEENNIDQVCYYLFNIVGRAVCGYQLSPGDIICIIAACLIVSWVVGMVLGLLYKRFLLGAKGWEQVPLIGWYREFGNLEADGCDLVCRSKLRRIVEYKEPTFGAETDSEDEKDDNLLPM